MFKQQGKRTQTILFTIIDQEETFQNVIYNRKKTTNKRKNLWYGQSVSSDPNLNATDASILCTYKKRKCDRTLSIGKILLKKNPKMSTVISKVTNDDINIKPSELTCMHTKNKNR